MKKSIWNRKEILEAMKSELRRGDTENGVTAESFNEEGIDRYIRTIEEKYTNPTKMSRKEFISMLVWIKRYIMKNSDSYTGEVAIINKLIGDTRLFDRIVVTYDSSYINADINVFYNQVTVNDERYNDNNYWNSYKKTPKENKKKIDQMAREYEYLVVHFQFFSRKIKSESELLSEIARDIIIREGQMAELDDYIDSYYEGPYEPDYPEEQPGEFD